MSGHRFDEDLTEDLTVAQIAIRVDTAFAHCRPAKASRGEIGEMTATRHLGPGSYRWIDQKSDGKNDDAQHGRSSGSLSPDFLKLVLRALLDISPRWGTRRAVRGCRGRGVASEVNNVEPLEGSPAGGITSLRAKISGIRPKR